MVVFLYTVYYHFCCTLIPEKLVYGKMTIHLIRFESLYLNNSFEIIYLKIILPGKSQFLKC